MKFTVVCCVFIVAMLYKVEANTENIVAADPNIQSRSSEIGQLIIASIVAADPNVQSRSSDQGRLIVDGIIAAEQSNQTQSGDNKLQLVVSSTTA
ncbi:unnamed protein product [Rotaria magnacalcarata]|uniref:Uncharacterized protein n=2 Tax=Rotaria magnacalcarata TaxID=392030 RepID=A0A819NZB8_9BILA|nr:unnamed protein product [Rotaria magnacalcarata]CAF4004786.1 unnamed protein product [Rotaria magnacalcarata]CAF4147338.1 unnamed protein product [Rotaria magnacalcarata]